MQNINQMKKITFYITIICFTFISSLDGQDFNNYKPLESKGKIPKKFISTSTQKYKNEIQRIQQERSKNHKEKKEFALETNFVLDDLLKSGLVLFNDPISNYVNEVTQQLLENDPQLKKKVTIYTLRSPIVNAFATNRGDIFVTMGLIARIQNEAQLAYIIAHELTHVKEKHQLNLYLEAKDFEASVTKKKVLDKSVLNKSVFDKQLLAKNRYSRKLESEADEKGLELFFKTNYSSTSLLSVFDVLKYANAPFDNIPFELTFFSHYVNYQFPQDYQLSVVLPLIGEDEKEDDSKSTHPNLKNRRTKLDQQLKRAANGNKQTYIVSKKSFSEVQQLARFELPMLYLHQSDFVDAIYGSYLLLQHFPNSKYLKKCIGKALYAFAKYKNQTKYEGNKVYSEVEGESQQLHYFLGKIPDMELTILALHYSWALMQQYQNDSELQAINEDLGIELGRFFNDFDQFYSETEIELLQAKQKKQDTIKKEEIKEQGIPFLSNQYGKTRKEANTDKTYWKYAFAPFLDTPEFKKLLKKAKNPKMKKQQNEDIVSLLRGESSLPNEAYYQEQLILDQMKRSKKGGLRLGIDRIVIVNPFCLKLDTRKENNQVNYIQTEIGQDNLRSIIEKIAPISKLKTTILDVSHLKSSDVEKFNEIRLINDWFSEQVSNSKLTRTPGFNQDRVDAIAEKYKTNYFLWTGTISLRTKNDIKVGQLLVSLLFPVATPILLTKMVSPSYEMLFYAVLYNIKTGEKQIIKFDFFGGKDTNSLLKTHFYDVLMQIKTKK